MQLDVPLLKDWLTLNKLYLNAKKAVFMIFHKPLFNLIHNKQIWVLSLLIVLTI